MKKILISISLLATAMLSAGYQDGALNEKPFYGNERPARNIQIGRKPILTLLPGKSCQAEIVIEENAYPATKYAAEMLRLYLGKRLKTEIPVVNRPDPAKSSIFLGISQWSKMTGIDDGILCRDAFIIKTAGKDLYILGRDDAKANLKANDRWGGVWGTLNEHATLFGVYDFLERFGGIRFYFPNENGICIPENKPLEIPEINLFDRPDFEARNVSLYSGQWEDEKIKPNPASATVSPQKNIYSKMLRLQTKYIPNCHGLRALKLDRRFAGSHPEYFALRSDGRRYNSPAMMFSPQLCYSSKVMDVIAEDAVAIIHCQAPETRGLPDREWGPTEQLPGLIFGMMPQDAYQNCQCSDCRKELSSLQSISNFMWRKTAEIAGKITKNAGHGYVTQMAYYPYHLVPETELPGNVLVMVAAKGPWSAAQPELLKKENERIRAWNRKLKHKVWLWNYAGKFGNLSMPGIPSATPRAIAEYYRSHKNDIYGAYMESESDKLIYHYLNYYVFSKVAWNNDIDADALLKEHYALMFGKAAPVMEKVFDLFERLWIHRIGGRTVETTLGPVGAPPSENELWTKVYTKQRIDGLVSDFDNAEKLADSDRNALRRVRYIRKEFLNPLVSAAEQYRKRNSTLGSFRVELPATVSLQPFQGKNPRLLKTAVKITADSEVLSIRFNCEEPETAKTIAPERRPDDPDIWRDNNIEIFLDPAADGKGFHHLIVNSRGCLTDQYCTSLGSGTRCDPEWNSRAEIKTSVTPEGWRASVRIPLKSFRSGLNPGGFTANFTRSRVLENEQQYYSWSPFLRQSFHELENFGTLVPEKGKNRNILKTGDFGAGRNGRAIGAWILPETIPEGAGAEPDKSTFVLGSQSLKMTNTNRKTKFVFAVTQTATAIKPNAKYRLSFFVQLKDIVPLTPVGGICVNIWNKRNLWLPANKYTGTEPWFRQSFEFTASPETNPGQTYIKLVMYECTGTAWFDGIALEEIQ